MKFINILRLYRYEFIAFFTGAAVMILEIVGARIIAPYFGTSIYVWTAIIGVILGSLALGYWYGGRIADHRSTRAHLSFILTIASLVLLVSALAHVPILEVIASFNFDVRLSAVLGASVLFGLPSALVGAVSPHLAKIRVTSLKTTGQSVGRLEAAGAIGSIGGTFLSGYVLLGWFGSQDLMLALVILLIGVSLLADPRRLIFWRLGLAAAALLFLALPGIKTPGTLSDTDSSYARYQVKALNYNGQPARVLQTDYNSYQSGVYTNSREALLPFAYANKFLQIFDTQKPASLLTLGGGTYVIPTTIASKYPGVTVDVVEIDPALDGLAQKYFNYQPSDAIKVYHEDGRTFLNSNQRRYDMVFVDAYGSLSPPFQLTTKQAVAHMKNALLDNSLVVANVISYVAEGRSEYLESLLATYKSSFEFAVILQARTSLPLNFRQNFLIIASDSFTKVADIEQQFEGSVVAVPTNGAILTDDFAPVERLTASE